MTLTDHERSEPLPVDNERRIWNTAETAFLQRYAHTPHLPPEEVAKWAVEGAVALHNEFRMQKPDPRQEGKEDEL